MVPHSGVEQLRQRYPKIQTVDLLLCDLNGILRGKRIAIQSLHKAFSPGICLPPSCLAADITGETVESTGLGFAIGDMDLFCLPTTGQLHPVPWQGPERGQMFIDMHDLEGKPLDFSPRQVLKRVIERFDELGLTPVVAVELEFYLTDNARNAEDCPQPPIDPVTGEREYTTQVYGMTELDHHHDFIAAIAEGCKAQKIPADTAVAEYAPGQFEINLLHESDALSACDHAIMLKRLIKGVAEQQGLVATFMAKPYPDQVGSGTHIHVSLLDEQGHNVFAQPAAPQNPRLHQAIAGLQQTLPEIMLLLAPNANSYRRFVKDTFVPLTPTWGFNNRTVALRIPYGPSEATRIEHRVAGADANPYLACAAVLMGIHAGLSEGLQPTPPIAGNAYQQSRPTLPDRWLEAIDHFADSERCKQYLGERFCQIYLAMKDEEESRFQRHITTLEYRWYWRTL